VGRTDAASRFVDASPAQVYAAFTDRDALLDWLPPAGMTGTFERFDLRAGGGYQLVLRYSDPGSSLGKATDDSDVVCTRFTEIVPGIRVVQEVDFVAEDPAFAGTMTMTWEVTPVDGGSRVHITAEDVPEGISAADHAAGFEWSLDNLAAHLRSSGP
jgi:uncharacterized protein YndB with AHSA1/START domain